MQIIDEQDVVRKNFKCDLVVCALGYETRSRFIAENNCFNSKHKIAISFNQNPGIARTKNESTFKALGYTIIENSYEQMANVLQLLNANTKEPLRVVIDISSMSREMMATVVLHIKNIISNRPIELNCAYAPTAYYKARTPFPIEKQGPIVKDLGGWAAAPERPLAALVGLGNEIGLAVGALQAIEPSLLWTFTAVGLDSRFEVDVGTANDEIGKIYEYSDFQYFLTDPISLRHDLSNKIRSLLPTHRVMIMPMGPKIFSYMAIITAFLEFGSKLAVWQFSSGQGAIPVDREAVGKIIWHTIIIEC